MIVRLSAAAALVMLLAGWGPPPAPGYDPRYVAAPAPVALMIGPGSGYGLLATVPANVPLPIVTCEYRTGWCQVRYGRYDGWVYDPSREQTHDHYGLLSYGGHPQVQAPPGVQP